MIRCAGIAGHEQPQLTNLAYLEFRTFKTTSEPRFLSRRCRHHSLIERLIMNRLPLIVIAAAAIVAGCSRPGIRGDGAITTDNRPISEISKLVVMGGYDIEWSSGKPALTITTDQNLLPLVKTVSSGNTLQIDSKAELLPTRSIKIILSSATLGDVHLNGGIRFKASHISSHDLRLESHGASEISVDGSVTNLEAKLTGASKLNATSLQTQDATISLDGAWEADVTVTDSLRASVSGAGSLTYSGNPKSVEKNISGAGFIQNRP